MGDIVLASASPRRRALLEQIGVRHTVRAVAVDEAARPGEGARAYVERLALAKARAGWRGGPAGEPVIGADTIIVVDGEILGKPTDRADGCAMLARLSGRTHEVVTAVAVVTAQAADLRVSVSRVRMRAFSPTQAAAYWETGEPVDKAGAYAIQGLGAVFVEHLEGSYSGVMGLPLCETAELLEGAGLRVV